MSRTENSEAASSIDVSRTTAENQTTQNISTTSSTMIVSSTKSSDKKVTTSSSSSTSSKMQSEDHVESKSDILDSVLGITENTQGVGKESDDSSVDDEM